MNVYKFYHKISFFYNMNRFDYKEILIKQFLKSIAAVNPAKLITENLKVTEGKLRVCNKIYDLKNGNVYLVGFGKAVLGMASQCEKILKEYLKKGIICVPDNTLKTFENDPDFSLKLDSVIEVFEGAKNNLPDKKAEEGTDAIIKLVNSLNSKTDNLIVLMSGGGSALLTKPKPGITLAEKLETILLLTSAGANITELNTIRKKLSQVKGGSLASLSYPVETIALILSDVINDPLEIIASGPTVPNMDSNMTALNILQKYDLENKITQNALNLIKNDTLLSPNVQCPVDSFFHVSNFIIGNNSKALDAAKKYSEFLGFESVLLSKRVYGSVDQVSDFYVNLLFEILNSLNNSYDLNLITNEKLSKSCYFDIENNFTQEINRVLKQQPSTKKICIVAGGEITVKVKGNGKGGRSQELALVTSFKVHELKMKFPYLFMRHNVIFLMAGTDGIDGPTDAAGAIGEAEIIEKAQLHNLNVKEFIENNDSYNFFQKIDGGLYLIKTGHTGTNVMDVHSFLIYER